MANIKSFPNNQDEYIGAEYVMKWLHGRTSGVFAADNNAAVAAVQGAMAATVSDGLGWITNSEGDGVVWWNDVEKTNGAKLQLTVDAADSTLNRIDRVIVEWKTTNYVDLPEIKILKGTAAGTAKVPALTNNSTVRQISLARISIAAGTTEITPSMITDERLDPSVCGLVTDSISIDTSVVNAQFQELLEQLRRGIEEAWDGVITDGSITPEKLAPETKAAFTTPFNYADNSDFTQWVAQTGIGGNHGSQAYGGDRWKLDSGTITGTARTDGNGYENITLNGTIRQIVANPPATGTVGVDMISGTATASYADGEITITSSGGVIKDVWLYEGIYEAGAAPKYQPKGYGAELVECLWYFVRLGTGKASQKSITGTGVTGNTPGQVAILIPLPVQMRILPSATISGDAYMYGAEIFTQVTSFSPYRMDAAGVSGYASTNATFAQFRGAILSVAYLDLSADLE